MSDFIIGLDLDGVCYDWDKTMRYMLRRRIIGKGARPPEELYRPARFWNEIEQVVSSGDWRWLWGDGVRDGLFRYGHVITGAIEGVRALNDLGEVVVITHRPKVAVHDTTAWLSLMFDKAPLAGLVIQSNGQRKSAVEPRPDIYIDDAIHVVNDILGNTESSVILFDQPWNQKIAGDDNLYRAIGWDEVVMNAKMLKEAL